MSEPQMTFEIDSIDARCVSRWPKVGESTWTTTEVRTFRVLGDYVYTETLPSGRRRRFLIERLEIRWISKDTGPWSKPSVSATGRSIIGPKAEVSKQSKGYVHFWERTPMPAEIAELVAQEDASLR